MKRCKTTPKYTRHGLPKNILVGGHNIERALKTAALYQPRDDCVVRPDTSTVSGVDTYKYQEERGDGNEEDEDKDEDEGGVDISGRTTPLCSGQQLAQRNTVLVEGRKLRARL